VEKAGHRTRGDADGAAGAEKLLSFTFLTNIIIKQEDVKFARKRNQLRCISSRLPAFHQKV